MKAPVILLIALPLLATSAAAQQGNVRATMHNLSVSGTGQIKSSTETEVCKFCHIPHSAIVPQPLWGHALSSVKQYQVPQVRSKGTRILASQPDGSSRLCLSCHDGTVALADVGRSPRKPSMSGPTHLAPTQHGFIGIDLSGSHPVSIRMPDGSDQQSADDMGLKSLAVVQADRQVRLDESGKIQCTTCHDPHSDQYYRPGRAAHFAVKPSTTEICVTCHEVR